MELNSKEGRQLTVNLNPTALEADVAYFSARLELIGHPETSYQAAQCKVYQALEQALKETLQRLRGSESKKDRRDEAESGEGQG